MGFGRPYIRRMYGLNLRIWTVFAGGAGFDSQQQQYFLLFLVIFFSRTSFSRAFPLLPFSIDACFALIISFIGGYGS
jgi:hypothetical protein